MTKYLIDAAEEIALFCRLNLYRKRDLPIRASEMGVLIFVQKSKEPVTPLRISEFLGISKPSVSSLIQSLIKSNYLLKVESSKDKRSYGLILSVKGKELVENTYREYLNTIEVIEKHMKDEDFSHLLKLIKITNDILKEYS